MELIAVGRTARTYNAAWVGWRRNIPVAGIAADAENSCRSPVQFVTEQVLKLVLLQ